MNTVAQIRSLLQQSSQAPKEKPMVFFKTGVGHYAEHDQFMGVTVPTLRKISKRFQNIALLDVKSLIVSPINEERLLALLIMILQYQAAEKEGKEILYQFYCDHLQYVNNWNLVDSSAHWIVGAHLFNRDKEVLLGLAKSNILWERRVAIVSTWYFIRNNDLVWTFKIAEILLKDPHDLIHKAVGWMLREAGKRDQEQLTSFLDRVGRQMPRTMLRYAIEKFPEEKRKSYLK